MDQVTHDVTFAAPVEPPMRVLMAGVCPSLSGASEISFCVGCPEGAKDVSSTCFKIAGNSSSGRYNEKWVSINDIERCLAEIPSEQPFPIAALKSIYVGGSANSHGFLGSILLHVQIISRAPEGQLYVRHTATAFWDEVKNLIAAGTDLPVPTMEPSAAIKEVAPAKPTKSAKKSASSAANG